MQHWTESVFDLVLEAEKIDNPFVEITEGILRHKYTPHSCQHTFSTLVKRVDGNSKERLELIGHTREEMLHYYQDFSMDDLRKITDQI